MLEKIYPLKKKYLLFIDILIIIIKANAPIV